MAEAAEEQPESSNEEDREPHQIRITTHGKIKAWVNFALDFLQSHPTKPLLLHTRSATHSSSIAVTPRLITVAEIIKREYLRRLREIERDRTSWSGLHQYNEIQCLEDVAAGSETNDVVAALQGKNFPKQKQLPVMTITLSREPLPHLEDIGATYQLPSTLHLSKTAKARMRKRKAKSQGKTT